jgi:hypothetical protein
MPLLGRGFYILRNLYSLPIYYCTLFSDIKLTNPFFPHGWLAKCASAVLQLSSVLLNAGRGELVPKQKTSVKLENGKFVVQHKNEKYYKICYANNLVIRYLRTVSVIKHPKDDLW